MEKGEDQSLDNSSGSGTQQSNRSESDSAPCGEGYKFTDGEAQLLRICIDAMHTAGLAFIVQGISTMLLGKHCLMRPEACRDLAGRISYQIVHACHQGLFSWCLTGPCLCCERQPAWALVVQALPTSFQETRQEPCQ